MSTPAIALRGAYDEPSPDDGYRVLVDRRWPQGLPHSGARIDEWLRDLAPSNKLHRWFDHHPAKWEEFRRRYRAEVVRGSDELDQLLYLAERGPVTLVFGARDEAHNNAVVLRELLEERLALRWADPRRSPWCCS